MTTTVLFLDLSRFTALTDIHGDQTAVDVADHFITSATSAADEIGGRLVKTLGDGALFVFDTPAAAIQAADATSHRLHDAESMPEMTGGAATGPVIDRDSDVFGATVNLAARLADLAPSGEMRVDEATARAAAEDRWQVEPLGPVEVRGFHEPRAVFRLLLCHPEDCVVDPVCGMRITPGPATPTSIDDNGGQVWFCSATCRDRFLDSATAGKGDDEERVDD